VVNSWLALRRLEKAERRIALEAAAGLMATWAGLRLFGFRRWKSVMERFSGDRKNEKVESVDLESAGRVARLEAGAARRLLPRTNCLEQSLVLWWLLKRRGIESNVRIGGRKEAEKFEAHAWVELNGMAVDVSGETHLHFVPFKGTLESAETKVH